MPALEIMPDNTSQIEQKYEVAVPEIRGLTVAEAIEKLKEMDLDYCINDDEQINKSEVKVKDQLPKPGLKIFNKTKVEILTK